MTVAVFPSLSISSIHYVCSYPLNRRPPSQPRASSLLGPPFSCIQSSLFPPAFPKNIPRFHGSPSQKLDLMDLHQTHFAQATFSLRAFFTHPCATLRLHRWKKKQTLNGFLRSRRAFYLNLSNMPRSLDRPTFSSFAMLHALRLFKIFQDPRTNDQVHVHELTILRFYHQIFIDTFARCALLRCRMH